MKLLVEVNVEMDQVLELSENFLKCDKYVKRYSRKINNLSDQMKN